MLKHPDATQLRALLSAQSSGTWEGIDQLLESELAAIMERLVGCRDDVDLYRLQGRAAALRDLRATARSARETLDKVERSGTRPPIA